MRACISWEYTYTYVVWSMVSWITFTNLGGQWKWILSLRRWVLNFHYPSLFIYLFVGMNKWTDECVVDFLPSCEGGDGRIRRSMRVRVFLHGALALHLSTHTHTNELFIVKWTLHWIATGWQDYGWRLVVRNSNLYFTHMFFCPFYLKRICFHNTLPSLVTILYSPFSGASYASAWFWFWICGATRRICTYWW